MNFQRHLNFAWALSTVLLWAGAQAQDYSTSGPYPPGYWGSVQLLSGTSTVEQRDLFPDDFRSLTAGSDLVPDDLSDFSMRHGDMSADRAGAFLIALGMHPFHTGEKPGPELRLGLHYAGGTTDMLTYSRTDRSTVDTLSSSSGQLFFVDSVRLEEYQFRHQAERFGMEAVLIFRSANVSRWSLFGGGGLAAGALLNARTTVRHTVSTDVLYPNVQASRSTTEELADVFRESGGGWVAAQAVLGFAFRLARQGDFLRRMDLFFEARPQMLTRFGGDLGGSSSFGSQQMLGLRVRLYEEP